VVAMTTIPLQLPEIPQNLSHLPALWATFILILAFLLHDTYHVSWA